MYYSYTNNIQNTNVYTDEIIHDRASFYNTRAKLGASTRTRTNIGATAITSCSNDFYNVEWVGNHIFWPQNTNQCRLNFRNTDALRRQFRGKKLLFIGDSLSRRFAYTFRILLEGQFLTHDELDFDKVAHGYLNLTKHGVGVHFQWAPTIRDVIKKFQTNLTDEFDMIVISIGVHDAFPGNKVANDVIVNSTMKKVDKLLQIVKSKSSKNDFFMRIEPPPSYTKSTNYALLQSISNRLVNEWYDTRMVLDTRRIIESRTTGSARIAGNTPFHYGSEARTVFVQSFAIYMDLICRGNKNLIKICQ